MHDNLTWAAFLFWLIDYWWFWIPATLAAFFFGLRWLYRRLTAAKQREG